MLAARVQEAISTRGNLARLAELSELDDETIRKIAHGRTRNPGILTVQALEAALDQLDNSQQPTEGQPTEGQPTEGQPAEAAGVSDGDDAVGVRA